MIAYLWVSTDVCFEDDAWDQYIYFCSSEPHHLHFTHQLSKNTL